MPRSRIIIICLGLLFLYIGAAIFLHSLGISFLGIGSIIPFIILWIGYFFIQKQQKVTGILLFIIGIFLFLDDWFGIHFQEIIGIITSMIFLYLGYSLIRIKGNTNLERNVQKRETMEDDICLKSMQKKHSFVGSYFLTRYCWELQDMNIWHGIGDVDIDLTRASVPEEKSTIVINGWIGDIDISVPKEIDLSISVKVGIGDLNVFGNKESGLNRSMTLETTTYRTSVKRVEIVAHVYVGNIDIVHL